MAERLRPSLGTVAKAASAAYKVNKTRAENTLSMAVFQRTMTHPQPIIEDLIGDIAISHLDPKHTPSSFFH